MRRQLRALEKLRNGRAGVLYSGRYPATTYRGAPAISDGNEGALTLGPSLGEAPWQPPHRRPAAAAED
jgi:hypothetical protein